MFSLLKILLVEDDRNVAGALIYTLQSSFDIDLAISGKTALIRSGRRSYDIIVLDLNLPDMSGLDVCKQLRQKGISTPILILSAETHVLTKINLLDAGANDYLTKPFSLGELKARLRALSRDSYKNSWPSPTLEINGVRLDRQSFSVSRDDNPIILRRKEFALLDTLMEKAGKVVTSKELLQAVWPEHDRFWTNTLAVHIKYLRDKLDRPFSVPLITTVHGRGYIFETAKHASDLNEVKAKV